MSSPVLVPTTTWRSPGKNVEQIEYPHSMVRRHAVVRAFQILSVPFAAEAMTWSSDEIEMVRMSCLWPGSSSEWVLVGSGELPSGNLDLRVAVGEGIVYVSSELFDKARRSCL